MAKILAAAIVIIVVGGIAAGAYYIGLPAPSPYPSPTQTPTPTPEWHLLIRRTFLWENGTDQFVAGYDASLTNYLLQIVHKVNLQLRCVFADEQLQKIKKNDKAVELRYRFYEDITTSQWIEPKDREIREIRTDENGYRVLEKVSSIIFVLKDNLGEGLEGNILIEQYVIDEEGEFWGSFSSCWAIQKDGELDKSWIEEIERYLYLLLHS